MSLFYVSEEVARRQPYRDLRTAVIDGRLTRRHGAAGETAAYWGTFDIEPVVLRDGRVQGFSYVTRTPERASGNRAWRAISRQKLHLYKPLSGWTLRGRASCVRYRT